MLPEGTASTAATWRNPLLRLGLAWAALLALFAPDWLAMFRQWWDSSTYNQVLLIPPILAWLAWQRWPELRKLRPEGWYPGIGLLGAATLVWVLGAFSGFDLLRHAGAVAMLPTAVLLVLGPKVGAGLCFPLCYMGFLVPFGDELVPALQTVTAKMTIALVDLSGVPAKIDGVFIDTPAGLFEVAEACSGVKFLIAMIALGVLVANVCFTSWKRRAAFLTLCVVAPVLANGARAWGTIFAAQYVGVEVAAGVDHIVYGWIFFALVIAAVLGLSWKHFDRAFDDPMTDAAAIEAAPWLDRLAARRIGPVAALVAVALVALGGTGWAQAANRLAAPAPDLLLLPEVSGWKRVDYAPLYPWEPRAAGADHRLLGRYRDAAGNTVDVFYAFYTAQGDGKDAGGFGEGALRPESGWSWTSNHAAPAPAKGERLIAEGRAERLAETWYRSGSLLTGSNARLKLANIGDRLVLRARPTTVLILSAEASPGHPPAAALDAFRHAVGPVDAWMDRIARLR